MDAEEVEAVLEKIWDLHDKLSDAIHNNSRSHFLISTGKFVSKKNPPHDSVNTVPSQKYGYVFTKEPLDTEVDSILESRSLNAIRSALENLEDQLEFFHTVQIQQRAERDAAIARLEQSRLILAMRLAEHHGKQYKVIEEALAFVGDVQDASRFVFPETLYGRQGYMPCHNNLIAKQSGLNPLLNFFVTSFGFLKKSVFVDHIGGLLGSTAVFTVSLFALLHLHKLTYPRHSLDLDSPGHGNIVHKLSRLKSSSTYGLNHLDVELARG